MNDNEKALFDLLQKRYCAPGYALIPQVRRGTGMQASIRTADAIAISLWPSRGIEVTGFEFKSYRSDWTKELKQPDKAEEIAQYCDYWYIVATDNTIVKVDEVPSTWGLLIPRSSNQLKTVKAATKMNAVPLDRLFVASILRRIDQVKSEFLHEQYLKGRREGIELEKKSAQGRAEENKNELESLRDIVDEFEKSAGITIRKYSDNIWATPEERGVAFRMILKGDHHKELKNLEDLHKRVGEAIQKHKKEIHT